MCGGTPSAPKPPPRLPEAPVPPPVSSGAAAGGDQRRRAASGQGTILTSPLGASGTAATAQKTLLGE